MPDWLTQTATDRIVKRALLVRRLERIQTVLKRDQCEDAEEGEFESGYPGFEPCYLIEPFDEGLCTGCLVRLYEKRFLSPALKSARARLRYALDRIGVSSNG